MTPERSQQILDIFARHAQHNNNALLEAEIKMICVTPEEWAEWDEQERKDVERIKASVRRFLAQRN